MSNLTFNLRDAFNKPNKFLEITIHKFTDKMEGWEEYTFELREDQRQELIKTLTPKPKVQKVRRKKVAKKVRRKKVAKKATKK